LTLIVNFFAYENHFLVLSFFPLCLLAQESKVFDSLSFESKILNKQKTYAVYLPPGYESSGRKYPVLYLLHGAGVINATGSWKGRSSN
jgi:predicted alpha/beta superfamily hydrolase